MEAEKVEPLGASSEVHDPGLLRVQSQPEHVQHRGHQLAGLFGLAAGVVQDDEVIRILRQHPHRRPPPGSPVIGRASLPATPQATGPRRLSRVPRTTIRTFNAQYAGGSLSARSWNKNAFHGLRRLDTGSAPSWPHPEGGGIYDDAYSGFTHVADRTVAHAPLRTRPLDHARGHRYQGPRHLPGPDSHRQAALNLSLRYVMSTIPSSQRQSSLGAHRAEIMPPVSHF